MSQAQEPPEVQWCPGCVLCKEPVKLEESMTNEYGQAVHENCYVQALRRA